MRRVRADVAIAHDEVVLRERGDESRSRVEPVACVQHRGELGMDLVGGAELSVQVIGDCAAEGVVVVEREAEGRDAMAGGRCGLGELRRLGALAGAVDAFDREQDSHRS